MKTNKVKGGRFSDLYCRMLTGVLLLLSVVVISLPGQLFANISDGANGGNEHFHFYPPLVPDPSPTDTFTGSVDPVVQICEWTGTECVLPLIAEFTTTTGGRSERIRVYPENELYIVNWNTKGLDETKTYRIRVLFRIPEEEIEKELGYVDVIITKKAIPIKFRIGEGFFPIGELTPTERAKISPVLLEQFISQQVTEPVEALVNVFDDQTSLPELGGLEVLKEYKNIHKAFVQISDSATLASLAQSNNIKHVFENGKFELFSTSWQNIIGQNLAEFSGYIGTGTAIVILDAGGGNFPDHWIVDLTDPEFGPCDDVGSPPGVCRVVETVDFIPEDPYTSTHATQVASRVTRTAPGADLIILDVCKGSVDCDYNSVSAGLDWVIEHLNEYNIVAVNMSFGDPGSWYSTKDCLNWYDYELQLLRDARVMPIAASGNDGRDQTSFDGIAHPACSQYVVSVGSSDGASSFEDSTTRGPNLDLLAPAGARDTSSAAPQVSGAQAIFRAALPDLGLDYTLDLWKTNGVPITDPISGQTFKRIQIDAALRAEGLPVPVYENGASTHSGGSDVGQFIVADDFSLPAAATVSGASVDVNDGPASDPNRRWDGTVEWWLFASNSGLPGSLIASGTGRNIVQRNIVESPLGFRDFTVDFDFGEDIALPAGETFWLGLHMQADYSRVSVLWDFQGSTVGNQSRKGGELIGGVPNFVDGGFAGPSAFDKAFRLWAN